MEFKNSNLELEPNQIYYTDFYSFLQTNSEMLSNLKNQYIQLMSELTICNDISDDVFLSRISEINEIGTIIIGYKFIDDNYNQIEIVGSGTIIIEPKIIRGGSSVGHIEDIVVKSTYRGKKISQSILNELKKIAVSKNCYKVILDCDSSVVPVYKSNGFDIKGFQMSFYF